MESLTRDDLRMELRWALSITEATLRSAFREELGGILALLQQSLGPETGRFPSQPAPSNASTDVDVAETNPSTARSATPDVALVYSRGPEGARHVNGTRKSVDMLQESTELLDSLELPSEKLVAKICARDMRKQISGGSYSSSVESVAPSQSYKGKVWQISKSSLAPCESLDVRAPLRIHPPAPVAPAVFLPGEVRSPRSDKLREAAHHSPVMAFNGNMAAPDEVVASLADTRISNSDNRNSEISAGSPPPPGCRVSQRSADSSIDLQSSRTVGSYKIKKIRTSEDRAIQPTSKFTLRRWAACIVGHWIFDYVVAALIMLNGVLVGVQTEHLAQEITDEAPIAVQVLEMIFCVVFTMELCLRLCTYGGAFFTMSGKGWNLFDLFVVTAQILEIIMDAVASGMGYSFILLRVLRLIRVVRLARALRLIGELRTIVSSVAGSMKPLFWTGVLLFMVVYVLGVFTTQVVLSRRVAYQEDNETAPSDLELYWGSLGKSIMSLFQSITGGIDWDQVVRPLVEHISPEMGILFSMYIGFTVFCMLNVVTGVFIESVMKNAKSENEFRAMNHVMQLFAKLDVHHTGEITWEDFQNNLEKKEMQEFFKTIDVDIDNARTLFELLDVNSSGSVDVREFMDGCLSIWAPTKGLDLRMILRDVNKVLGILLDEKCHDANSSRPGICVLAEQSQRAQTA